MIILIVEDIYTIQTFQKSLIVCSCMKRILSYKPECKRHFWKKGPRFFLICISIKILELLRLKILYRQWASLTLIGPRGRAPASVMIHKGLERAVYALIAVLFCLNHRYDFRITKVAWLNNRTIALLFWYTRTCQKIGLRSGKLEDGHTEGVRGPDGPTQPGPHDVLPGNKYPPRDQARQTYEDGAQKVKFQKIDPISDSESSCKKFLWDLVLCLIVLSFQVPIIVHGDVTIRDSNAALRYICRTHDIADHWYPKDPLKQARVDEYLHWNHLNTRANLAMYFQVMLM